jgi:DNA-directed RNA polymerase specialized sigma24 family protein
MSEPLPVHTAAKARLSEECALLSAALGGDPGAIRRLVDLLTPIVRYRVTIVFIKFRPRKGLDEEDLLQEVMMGLFADQGRLLRTWDPERGASLTQFCGLVAQRRAISLLRGGGAATLSDELDEFSAELTGSARLPEGEAASREELVLLLGRLQGRLSPLGLELFYRLMVHEEQVEDVEAATGLTRNAIYLWRSRLIRLANELRQELAQEKNPESVGQGTPSPLIEKGVA